MSLEKWAAAVPREIEKALSGDLNANNAILLAALYELDEMFNPIAKLTTSNNAKPLMIAPARLAPDGSLFAFLDDEIKLADAYHSLGYDALGANNMSNARQLLALAKQNIKTVEDKITLRDYETRVKIMSDVISAPDA